MSTIALPAGLDTTKPYVLLVDLSHWEPNTDFHALADAGIQGVITKCTDGLTYVDPTYEVFRKKAEIVARERGFFAFGGYHFFRPKLDEAKQVDFFLRHLQPKAGDILPCLDVEEDGPLVGYKAVSAANLLWRRTGRAPILYSGDAFFQDKLKARFGGGQFPLWIARYGHAPVTKCAIWQFTDREVVPGEPRAMDANVFYGSEKDFRAKLLLMK